MRKKIEQIPAVHIANPKTLEFQVPRLKIFLFKFGVEFESYLLFRLKLFIGIDTVYFKKLSVRSVFWNSYGLEFRVPVLANHIPVLHF